jgi:LPS O-antigen subunit length determinant protein (WzzB/FepE family)
MPDLLTVISRWWKAILGLVAVVAAIALFVLLTAQKQYLSAVTALPANSLAFDKGRIFNNSIQELYSSLGTPDELDPIIGTSKLDTLYVAMVKDFNLVNHYSTEKKKYPEYTAVKLLKANSEVAKDEFGQLKIKVWDLDPKTAAALAHGLFERLQALHQHLQNQSNELVLTKLQENYKSLGKDSTNSLFESEARQDQLREYKKLIAEYTMVNSTKPRVLLLVEDARPDVKPDRPKILLIFIISIVAAFMFGVLLALFLESRKRANAKA